eukprot:2097298-Rhodomonas_salina.2
MPIPLQFRCIAPSYTDISSPAISTRVPRWPPCHSSLAQLPGPRRQRWSWASCKQDSAATYEGKRLTCTWATSQECFQRQKPAEGLRARVDSVLLWGPWVGKFLQPIPWFSVSAHGPTRTFLLCQHTVMSLIRKKQKCLRNPQHEICALLWAFVSMSLSRFPRLSVCFLPVTLKTRNPGAYARAVTLTLC